MSIFQDSPAKSVLTSLPSSLIYISGHFCGNDIVILHRHTPTSLSAATDGTPPPSLLHHSDNLLLNLGLPLSLTAWPNVPLSPSLAQSRFVIFVDGSVGVSLVALCEIPPMMSCR
jgi:hypothetical protein